MQVDKWLVGRQLWPDHTLHLVEGEVRWLRIAFACMHADTLLAGVLAAQAATAVLGICR